MDIEELVKKYVEGTTFMFRLHQRLRAALTEQAEAYEQRIRELEHELHNKQFEAQRVPAKIRQFRHPQWADRSRWCDIENPSDEQSLAEAGMVFRTIYAAPKKEKGE